METQSPNVVQLTGRVSGVPLERILPSGDHVVSFRIVVPRSAAARRRTRQTVDTVECSVWSARLRRGALRLKDGDAVSVHGELRRTFRRAGVAVSSWVTVDVDRFARVDGDESIPA